jgi:hypothetical protein
VIRDANTFPEPARDSTTRFDEQRGRRGSRRVREVRQCRCARVAQDAVCAAPALGPLAPRFGRLRYAGATRALAPPKRRGAAVRRNCAAPRRIDEWPDALVPVASAGAALSLARAVPTAAAATKSNTVNSIVRGPPMYVAAPKLSSTELVPPPEILAAYKPSTTIPMPHVTADRAIRTASQRTHRTILNHRSQGRPAW